MKIDGRSLGRLLRELDRYKIILFHGDDDGLVRSRADVASRAVLGGPDDPFRLLWLDREAQSSLPDEAASLSLTGGRRVIRVRDAGDALTEPARAALSGPGDALVLLEAPALQARSRLRALLEKDQAAAVVACYPEEGRTLEGTINGVLERHGVAIDRDALTWLASQLGADHALTEQETEKLALYGADTGRIDLEAAQHCIGDTAALSLDDALFAATRGERAATDHALRVALAEGTTPVGLIRAALMHLQRLHRARLAMDNGRSAEEAVREIRPPVFFRRLPEFTRALERWPAHRLQRAMQALAAAELACKRTGAPAEAISAQALRSVAANAAAEGRLSRG